jgi:hypothetical protein
MYFLLYTRTALADPVADLAPGPAELGTAQGELEQRLAIAEAIERAVARLQSTFLVTPATDDLCRDVIRGPLATKIRAFATAWHDAAQRVQTQSARLRRTAQAATVTPVIDPDRRERIDDLLRRSREQEAGWLEFVSWMNTDGIEQCGLTLETGPGLPDPLVRGQGEVRGAVAILTTGRGFLCPAGVAAGQGVVVVDGPVCWSDQDACGCTPTEPDPAAVLGP